ncbi:eCIS core domain-containing protein [Labedaea rhizosphaerae]|uniref:eCIS core domain-containing protein n=1 Tax=Labedaea rhizosphaerae TaxID=598644 RepID=UPI001AAD0847|nr:DUF4157 domain-containing protein [Labedaea rhizosphaerae]
MSVAEPEVARAPETSLGLGNAAMGRLLSSGGPSFAAAAQGQPNVLGQPGVLAGGNRAVQRAIRRAGDGSGQAPEGFAGRLSSAEAGMPLPDQARETLEESFGTPLTDVRLHVGGTSADLAADVGARAFTVGQDIYFGQGEYAPDSPSGYELLAHEVTHTLQQGGGGLASATTVSSPSDPSEREAVSVARQVSADRGRPIPVPNSAAPPVVARDVSATDLIPDSILNGIRTTLSVVPGYTLLTQIVGKDLITDQPVAASNEQLLESLLTFGPFGAGVAPVLRGMKVIGEIVSLVTGGLAEHNLTLARIGHDVEAAWDEVSVTKGIDGNAAIVRRYVDAILRDVTAFVGSLVDKVLEMVRAAVAEVAEPHLETPEIKPVWDLARKVLHHDPLRGTDVDAPTVEILGDFLRLIGQEQVLAQMTERGTLQQTADWLDTQFATFSSITGELMALFRDAWAAIQPQNLPHLLDTLPQLAERAFALVRRIGAFASTVIGKVLEIIKKSLLGWLSENAHRMPGFHLMTVIIERNPFTGEAVPRTPENLIKGFITLMPNGEATYNQLAESGVIADAAGRITAAMTRLGISWDMVTGTFHAVWDMLTLNDLLAPAAAFERVLAKVGEPLGRILEFVTEVVKVVIELILKLMNFPSDLVGSIINNAMAAIEDIKKDPVAFLQNMLQALKAGFTGFFDEILQFLMSGLASWLFRGLGPLGITAPPDFTLKSILDLVLQVLGVTVDTLWQKLGKKIGPEKAAKLRAGVGALGEAWAFIKDVQEGGVAAVWHHLVDKLTGLWDMLLQTAEQWIMTQIIEKVTAKLISMLDPTGVMAVVNSFIAFFKAIQSAIDYLRDILQIVNEYVTTFAQVAAGNVAPGAEKIKQGLGHAVPVAIGFLANQVGLGNVPEKVVEIIGGLRQLIDEALDWLFDKAFELGGAALNALGLGGDKAAEPAQAQPAIDLHVHFDIEGHDHQIFVDPKGELMVASEPQPVTNLEHLRTLLGQYRALPPETPIEPRKALVDQMVALIKSDPELVAQLNEGEQIDQLCAEADIGFDAAVKELNALKDEDKETSKTFAVGKGYTAKSGWGSDDTESENYDPQRLAIVVSTISAQYQQMKITQKVIAEHPEILPTDAEIDAAFDAIARTGSPPPRQDYDVPRDIKPAVDKAWAEGMQAAKNQQKRQTSRAGSNDQGVMGRYGHSHAERQVWEMTQATAIGVSQKVCGRCRPEFKANADAAKKIIVIKDGAGQYLVFRPGKDPAYRK